MLHLIIGPTNCGKSTFIERRGLDPVRFAFELRKGNVPETGVLHYNLLSGAIEESHQDGTSEFLEKEPVLRKILQSGKVGEVTVLVAPISELQARAKERTVVEKTLTDEYQSEFWTKVIETSNLFAAYETLFDMLEGAKLDYEVLYSSKKVDDGFTPSDRVFVWRNLRGEMPALPQQSDIDALLALPGAEYQEVRLPYGKTTSGSRYNHLHGGRGATFAQFARIDFRDRAVLDIGSALGDMLFRAERQGASRLVGVEMMNKRYEASSAISALIGSGVELHNCNFMDVSFNETFDDVLILNVIHHVSDVRGFLHKAARLTRQRLIIELPTLGDRKYRSLGGIPRWIPTAVLDSLPIMGVSHSSIDQTFVMTVSAIERILSDVAPFRMERLRSPLANRELIAFHNAAASEEIRPLPDGKVA